MCAAALLGRWAEAGRFRIEGRQDNQEFIRSIVIQQQSRYHAALRDTRHLFQRRKLVLACSFAQAVEF